MFNINYENYDGSSEFTDIKVYDPRRSKTKTPKILQIIFTLDDLDEMCRYVFDLDSNIITDASLENMKILFNILDMQPYVNNDDLLARIEFITLILDARIDNQLNTKSLLEAHALRNCNKNFRDIIENDIINEVLKTPIPEATCRYFNNMIYESLQQGYSFAYANRLNDILQKSESGKYKKLSDFSKDIKQLLHDFEEDERQSEEYMREGNGFDLSESTMSKKMKTYLTQLKAPDNKLKTGIQDLNKMLNGGFESGRSYLFMGITGVGKSVILLSCALWMREYNKLPPIPGYRQAILFISQENSEIETVERIYNISVSNQDIRECDESDVVKSLKDAGIIIDKDDDTSINFIFKYFSDKEIGVTEIDDMISDYKKKGIMIIAVVQDYIEKLRPKYKASELRNVLGNIATELSELAKKRNIPVISAAQLNRMASSVVDNAVTNNKTNITKLLGKQNVSESWDIIKNVDVVIIINREIAFVNDKERVFLGFKLEKLRGRPSKDRVNLFLHPFEEENSIMLPPDIDLPHSLSRRSIEEFNPMEARSSGAPTFDTSSQSEFLESVKDLISDDFIDDSDAYVDMYKKADEKSKRMKSAYKIITKNLKTKKNKFGNNILVIQKYLPSIINEYGSSIVKIQKRKL